MAKRTNRTASIVMKTAQKLWKETSKRTGKRFYKTFSDALKHAWYFFKEQCHGRIDVYQKREKLIALGNPSRPDYEYFCEKEGIVAMTEKALVESYGVRHGSFGYDNFDMMVHQRRAFLSRQEYEEEKAAISKEEANAINAYDNFWSQVDERANKWA